MVSSDQFASSLPGRLTLLYGKEKESEKYVGGTIIIDEASGYFLVHNQVSLNVEKVFGQNMYLKEMQFAISVHNQMSINVEKSIRSKHVFARDAIRHGIPILRYRADNGIYRSAKFRDDLKSFGQSIQFCGVGVHHHNGVAEKGIRTISTAARAVLIHAMIHWSENVTLDLWPFAIKYASHIWNSNLTITDCLRWIIFYLITNSYDHQKCGARATFSQFISSHSSSHKMITYTL